MSNVPYQLSLEEVWEAQRHYNNQIKKFQKRNSSEWMINYILGTMSELGELLRETKWKQHRMESVHDFGPNVEEELADITKYVFSMWDLMGYSPEDMLACLQSKGEILEQLLLQETTPILQPSKVLILDLDGCIADFREGFKSYLSKGKWAELLAMGDEQFGIHMDLDNGWDYRSYEEAKIEFERDGGYNRLPALTSMITAVQELKDIGWYVVAYTARPHTAYKRIWADTWRWLRQHDLKVNELHFGSEARVLAACKYREQDKQVVAIEDNPVLTQRYIVSRIPVALVPQPYNKAIREHQMLIRLHNIEAGWGISDQITTLSHRVYSKKGITHEQPG